MKKYFCVFKLSIQEYLIYRLNFILWRFRSFVSFITLLIFWQAVYGSNTSLFGYEKAQMLTYVVGIAFLKSLVLSCRSADLAGQVRSGELNKFLTRPLRISGFWLSRDFADKLLNFIFAIGEIFLTVLLLKLPVYIPQNPMVILVFLVLVTLSIFLYFLISFVLSVSVFWTEDVWATRWLFGIVFLEFLSGAVFPLDILPEQINKIIAFTPFPYLVYFPLKIWLEQIPITSSLKVIAIEFCWLAFFYNLAGFLWQKGFKKFGAFGG